MIKKLNPSIALIGILILALAIIRIPNAANFTWLSNFSPVGAIALFGGTYFKNKWKAILFCLGVLFISDIFISVVIFKNQYGFIYHGWYWIYSIFILIVFIGHWIIKKVNIKNIFLASILAAITHWVLADFTVWLGGGLNIITQQPLTKDGAGLLQCLVQGFPYMKNFLLGTLVYSSIAFGLCELLYHKFPQLATSK